MIRVPCFLLLLLPPLAPPAPCQVLRLVKDLDPGTAQGAPSEFVDLNGTLLFLGRRDSLGGFGLWRSDGTSAGTVYYHDLRPGTTSGVANQMVAGRTRAYFFDWTDTLWVTDGTSAGTRSTGIWGQQEHSRAVTMGDILYYESNETVMRTDGTPAGTWSVGGGNVDADHLVRWGDRIAFAVGRRSGCCQEDVYLSDGSPNSATIIFQPTSPATNSSVQDIVPFGDRLAFLYYDAGGVSIPSRYVVHVYTDTLGTMARFEIPARTFQLVAVGDSLYWRDIMGNLGRWSDASGIDTLATNTTSFQAVGDRVFFSGTGPGGVELWVTDGTQSGTRLVKDIRPGSASSVPMFESAWNRGETGSSRYAVFTADDGMHGREFWISDGTETGTLMLADLEPGTGSVRELMHEFGFANGSLFLSAGNAATSFELHAIDYGGAHQEYGVACGGSTLPVPPSIRGTDGVLGGQVSIHVQHAPSTVGSLFLGVPERPGLTIASPCDLLFMLPGTGFTIATPSGEWSFDFPVPNDSALLGGQATAQALFLDPTAPTGIALTEGALAYLGN